MPGRPRGQFLALDQDNVAPALLGQVIKGPHPNDAATDDDNASLRSHEVLSPFGSLDLVGTPRADTERSPSGRAASNVKATINVAGASRAPGGQKTNRQEMPLREPVARAAAHPPEAT